MTGASWLQVQQLHQERDGIRHEIKDLAEITALVEAMRKHIHRHLETLYAKLDHMMSGCTPLSAI